MGDSTPVIEVLGLILIVFAFVLIVVLVLPKYLKIFILYFLRSSAEAVARDLSSLSSLSLASHECIMRYNVKTEMAVYSVRIDSKNYLNVERRDNGFCKEEKYEKDEFCSSSYPVIFKKELGLPIDGKNFVIRKKSDGDVTISVKE